MITTKNKHLSKSLKISTLNKDTLFELLFSVLIILIMTIIIINPKRYTAGTIEGLKLFVFSVLPGLFPFMLLTKILTELGTVVKFSNKLNKPANFLFKTPGISLYAFFMSILSGYPIGAKIISELYSKKLITKEDAKKMSVFCTTSGPIFVIGAIGISMFNSFKIGIIIYASHIISSILLGICYGHLKKDTFFSHNVKLVESKKENIFGECVIQTINSLFVVGAYITIFYLIAELFSGLGIFKIITTCLNPLTNILNLNKSTVDGFIYGILEVTRGAKTLSASKSIVSICACSGILSFSGISIIMQSMVFLKQAKIKMHNFVCAKVMHMIFSILICLCLCLVFFWNRWSNAMNCIFKFISVSFYDSKVLV